MLKNTKQVALLVSALVLTGCGTPGYSYKDGAEKSLKGAPMVLITPQIRVTEIGVGQQTSRRADMEEGARMAARNGVESFAKESGWFRTVPMPKLSEDEQFEFDQRMALLNANQLVYADIKQIKGGSAIKDLESEFKGSIGKSSVLSKVAEQTGATYGLLIAGSESFTTTAAKVVSVAAAVVTLGNSPLALNGTGALSANVVNLKTGRIIWMADDTTKRDLMDEENHRRMVKQLLQRSPFGE